MVVRSYRDLEVWRRSIGLVREVYRVSRGLPDVERFGLCSQMQRAAVSVPANIAEGCERDHTREYLRHLSIARGSLGELDTLLVLMVELGYSSSKQTETLHDEVTQIGRMLNALQQSLQRRLHAPTA